MNILDKILGFFSSQVRKSDVTLPAIVEPPHKITDNNQSIKNGAINEEPATGLRSETKPRRERSKRK